MTKTIKRVRILPLSENNYDQKIKLQIAEKIIRYVVPAIFILCIFTIILVVSFFPDQQRRIYGPTVAAGLMFIVWILEKKGKIRAAVNAFIVVSLLGIFTGMSLGGGITSPGFIFLVPVIGVMSWIYQSKIAVISAICVSLIGILFIFLNNWGIIPDAGKINPFIYWFFITWILGIMLIIAVVPYKMMHNALLNVELQKEDLTVAREAAEQADRLKSNFLAQMSHEIRTPVGAMMSFSQLLNSDYPDAEIPKEIFTGMENSGKRIIRTIDMILDISQIQSGSYEIKRKHVFIGKDILDKLCSEFSYQAKINNIELNLVYDKDFRIELDEYSITQLFANLIDNAIKYTPAGSVEIKIVGKENSGCFVEVKDTGIGISKVFFKDLFKPFTQEETGYTRKHDGTGLGMALVKEYAKMNNAEIEVESEKNKGTTFKVLFKSSIIK